MTKNNRLLLNISIVIAYTFITGVIKQYGEINSFLFSMISIFVILGVTFMAANTTLRFGAKYMSLGHKHREDMTNFGCIALIPVTFAVYLYSLDLLSGNFLWFLYIFSGVLGIYLLVSYLLVYVIMDEEKVIGRYLIQPKKVEIRYDEIEQVSFSYITNTLLLSGNGKKVFIDIALVDAKFMINTLTSKIDIALCEDAFTRLKTYYRQSLVKTNIEELDYFN